MSKLSACADHVVLTAPCRLHPNMNDQLCEAIVQAFHLCKYAVLLDCSLICLISTACLFAPLLAVPCVS